MQLLQQAKRNRARNARLARKLFDEEIAEEPLQMNAVNVSTVQPIVDSVRVDHKGKKELARVYLDRIVRTVGIPDLIHSDRDKLFTSADTFEVL